MNNHGLLVINTEMGAAIGNIIGRREGVPEIVNMTMGSNN